MLEVDILTKESCGGIPSYDHFITIVFVSQGGRFQASVLWIPSCLSIIGLQNYFHHNVHGFCFSHFSFSTFILADDEKFVLSPHFEMA